MVGSVDDGIVSTLAHFRDPVSAWTHIVWMVLAIPATVLLWQRSRGDRPKQISLLVFGLGTIACFGFSGLFHAVRVERLQVYLDLDHIGIYVLIASSCTGIAFSLLRGSWRTTILTAVWAAALVGVVSRLTLSHIPRLLNPTIYLVMGWGLATCHPSLVRAVGSGPVRLVWLGGLFYSIGAVFFMIRWPVIWDGVFASHELMHVCDMAGNLAHFWFIWRYVIPFDRKKYAQDVQPLLIPAGNLSAEIGNQSTSSEV